MTKRNCFLLISVFVVIAVLLVSFVNVRSNIDNEQIEDAGRSVSRQEWKLKYNNEEKTVRNHLKVLLVSGSDTFDSDVTSYLGADVWVNQSQVDFVLLLVFDLKGETITPVQLNRDTMCDVYRINPAGKVDGTVREQLALSHTYGSGGEDSVRNVARTVSRLLFGAPMDNYVCVTMSAVSVINDLVGGVPVTLDEDMTDLDPSFVSGRTVTLVGDQALTFVRTREHDPLDANLPRMSRQRQYLVSLIERARITLDSDPDAVTESFDDILPYMDTDLSLASYADYVNWFSRFKVQDILTPEGVYSSGERWAEFNVDQDDLWDVASEAFC